MNELAEPAEAIRVHADLHAPRRRASETVWINLMGAAAFSIVAAVLWLAVEIMVPGWRGLSPAFIFGGVGDGMFNVETSGVFPMAFGTLALVLTMTVMVIPIGVITAVYLHEYADPKSLFTRLIRMGVASLAGIPSIVFGLFGLGFFVYFVGRGMDQGLGFSEPVWGKPALIWASLTMAVLTIPVVVVATEESLRAVSPSIRDASFAMGATRWETLLRLVLPQAMPGILTGGILAVSRGAGEVAPIMFTGAAYLAPMPQSLHDQFMELGYHIYILATQSPDVERTKPLLFATAVVLLGMTFLLNLAAIIARGRLRSLNKRTQNAFA
jgi:phosphate transport system permease protein